MRQLTSLDAQFLALENSRQTGHVGSLAMLDPSTAPNGSFGCPEVQRLLSERGPQLPPLRWRLAEVPFGLDYPYWVEEPEIDLGYHVREMALASPGTDQQLADQVARIMSRPLDRARPLWELYVIEGHESGLVAVLTKIHHSVIDGLSGAEIMALLLDLTPEGREVPPTEDELADPPPSTMQMLGLGVHGAPEVPGADAALAAEGRPEPAGHTVRGAARVRHAEPRRGARAPRRAAAPEPRRAEDDLQRADHAAPPVRVRAALARRLQDGQERPRRDRQRRRRLRVRGRRPEVADRARRPSRFAAGGPGAGVGAHRRGVRHLRQPDPADAGRRSTPRSRTRSSGCARPTRRCRR